MALEGINAATSVQTTEGQTSTTTSITQGTQTEELPKSLAGDGKQKVEGEIKGKEPTDEELAAKNEKMSRKDAKAWVKNFMEENGCSKKEAKAAFKEEFGYEMPSSLGRKIGRGLFALFQPAVALVAGHGKIEDFIQNGF